jgi:membrane associated rhomboid family serine protease
MGSRIGSAAIFCVISGVFLFELAKGAVGNDALLLQLGALPDTSGIDHEYWRLIVAGFLHYDLTHLLLNILLLLLLGPYVERHGGIGPLLVIFLTASVASFLGINLKHQLWPSPGVSLGASGGMFGLLGAALVLAFRIREESRRIRIRLIAVLVLGLTYSALPGISMIGHIVGLILGAMVAIFLPARAAALEESRK